MTNLEKYIGEVSRRIGVHLEKTVETTPGIGNCWYESCALLSRINKVRDISAKQLREEVVNNLENCENFEHFFEICCGSDYKKLKEFKKKHSREGEFTDEAGGMVAATAFTLGVTI